MPETTTAAMEEALKWNPTTWKTDGDMMEAAVEESYTERYRV